MKRLGRLLDRRLLRPSDGILLALAVVAGVLVLYGTRWGPWAFSDGVGYLVVARNFLQGDGLGLYRPSGEFVPTVSHPPLYPLALAAIGRFYAQILQAARSLHAGLIFAFILIVPWLYRRVSGSAALATALALLLLVHPAIILMFLSSMSEPLFVLLGTISLLLLALYVTEDRPILLGMSCAFAALALLTRYVGIAYGLTGAIVLALGAKPPSAARRVVAAVSYFLLSLVPTLGFLVLTTITAGSAQPRGLQWPPSFGALSIQFLGRLANAVWGWKPVPTSSVIEITLGRPELRLLFLSSLVVLVGASAGIAIWLWAEDNKRSAQVNSIGAGQAMLLSQILAVFCGSFLGVMFLGFVFTDPTPDVDFRTMFPLLPNLILLAFSAVAVLVTRGSLGSKAVVGTVGVLIFFVTIGYIPTSLDTLTGLHRTGLGYTARKWHESSTLKATSDLVAEATLVSNAPEAILLFTGRPAYLPPMPANSNTWAGDESLTTEPAELETVVCNPETYLILFDAELDGVGNGLDPTAPPDDAGLACAFELVFESQDGTIYRYANGDK